MTFLYMIIKTYPVKFVQDGPAWLTDIVAVYKSKDKAQAYWENNDLGNKEGYRFMLVESDLSD